MKRKAAFSVWARAILCLLMIALLTGCGDKAETKSSKKEKKETEETEKSSDDEKEETKEITLLVEEPDNPTLRSDDISEDDFTVDDSMAGSITFISTDLNVRSLPTLAAECEGMLPTGTWVMLKGKSDDGGFYLIDFSGKDGYIRADLTADPTAIETAQSNDVKAVEDADSFDGQNGDKIPDIYWDYVNK